MTDQAESIRNRDLGKHVLVIGDFMIDQAWVCSGPASLTAQSHDSIRPKKRLHPTWEDKQLGGAGMTFMALLTFCQISNLDFTIYGLGIWNPKDDNLIEYLAKDGNKTIDNARKSRLYRLKVVNEGDVATTIKSRYYSYRANKRPQLEACYAQEIDLKKGQCLSFEEDPFPRELKKYLETNCISAVLVADFNKGMVQKSLLVDLKKYLSPDCLWFIDSKNPNICKILPQGIKIHTLTMNREEAVRLANELGNSPVLPIPRGIQPSIELLLLVQNLSERLSICLGERDISFDQLVIKLDCEGACLFNTKASERENNIILSQPQLPLEGEGIAAGDFFNASLLLSFLNSRSKETDGSGRRFKQILDLACSDSADWLQAKQDYWERDFSENERSDVVKASFLAKWLKNSISENKKTTCRTQSLKLIEHLEELTKPLCYEKIVNDRNCFEYVINLANAKGFLGDFISTDIHFRSNVRKFVQRINEYIKSTGYTKPLNCLIFAESGSGKSFFVNQLASETNCEIVTVNCNQTLSKQNFLEAIIRIQNIGEDRTPLLFLDEFEALDQDYYPLLLEPLDDAIITIDGQPRHCRERFVTILAVSTANFLGHLRHQNLPKGIDILSRFSGPRLTLSEEAFPSREARTSRVYRAVQILLRYHPTTRIVQRGLLDLIYGANNFSPRAIEHFTRTLPMSDDGIISLDKLRDENLKSFAENLGYEIEEDFKLVEPTEIFATIGYDDKVPVEINRLKSDQIRIISS